MLQDKDKSPPKNVGEVFRLLMDEPTRHALYAVAETATFAENAIWALWFKNDPLRFVDVAEYEATRCAGGKWPKLDSYVLGDCPDGPSPTRIARALCPGLLSYVYDGIANNVSHYYRRWRRDILTFRRRLPIAHELRIRFRERAVTIEREPEHPEYFRAALSLRPKEVCYVGLRTNGKSSGTLAWLKYLVESGEHPSGGCLSRLRRRGKWEWQISLARARQPDEREQVREPVVGRVLVIWAPKAQNVFLRARVLPQNGRPWGMIVESNDLCHVQARAQEFRRTMGANYHQSPDSGAHGHGRRRCLQGKAPWRGRYERRVKDWIENRSAAVVRFAVATHCAELAIEDLSARNSATLRLGPFPYHQLVQRIRQKAEMAGLKTAKPLSLATLGKSLSAEAIEGCEGADASAG